MSSDDEVKGKKRKAEEEDGEASSTSGVEGIPTDDGLAWDLGGTKLLRVKDFKGTTYVDIREFYEDKATGEKKPGKKGIMINAEQFQKMAASFDNIKDAVQASSGK